MQASRAEWDVLGLGNGCVDTILTVTRFPAPGVVVPVRGHQLQTGGQVATAMIACARLGLKTRFALRCGADAAGRMQFAALARAGVDLDLARGIPGVASARAYILVDETSGERSVIWNADERLVVPPEDLRTEEVTRAKLLYLDGKDEAAGLLAARAARRQERPVVSDIDCLRPQTVALIAEISDFIGNEEIIQLYTGGQGIESGLRTIVAQGPRIACATLGAQGAMAYDGRRLLRVPAFPVPVVDTTGAGDAFRAGYVVALLAGWELFDRLRFANATAALTCTALGAQAALPTRDQVVNLLHDRCGPGVWDHVSTS